MRRSLVLVDETARHPFRQSLPPHVRQGSDAKFLRNPSPAWLTSLREFMMAYCACFLAVTAYFA